MYIVPNAISPGEKHGKGEWKLNILDPIFLIQVSLGNKKSLGKWDKDK